MQNVKGNDSRFSRIGLLEECLKRAFAANRFNLKTANALSWLSPSEQQAVADWLNAHPNKRIGPIMANRLVKAKGQGERISVKKVEQLLKLTDGRSRNLWIKVPLNQLPQGLSKEEAKQWLNEAIETYKKQTTM